MNTFRKSIATVLLGLVASAALADATLRAEFAAKYPEAWSRIAARRTFMQETLGITLKPEVLPFSNIPAYLPPFLLSPRRILALG